MIPPGRSSAQKDWATAVGSGKVSFIWYRANLIPARLASLMQRERQWTAYVDDYVEVWINGQMARRAGYPSPAAIQGFNIVNRVVLMDAAKPGHKFQIAIFGIDGPISLAPINFVWFRTAKIEFFRYSNRGIVRTRNRPARDDLRLQ